MDRLLRPPPSDSARPDHPTAAIALPEELLVREARWIEGYKVEITFSDGSFRAVDFEPFLRAAQHPAIRAFLEPKKFQEFRVEEGDLLWGDYQLCFPVADLYDGTI